MIEVRPIGVLDMLDQDVPDQKILAVPVSSPLYSDVTKMDHVAPHVRREIEHFFSIYKELEGKRTEMRGWEDAPEACEVVHRSRRRYQDRHVSR
jgi:inorganic pyrophosphatase